VRALPVIVITSLLVSYSYAIAVTPVLCRMFLRPRGSDERKSLVPFGSRVASFATGRPRQVLLGTVLAIGMCAVGAQHVDKRFFPASERNQVIVTLNLPEGSDLLTTNDSARRLEQALLERPEVRSVATFVGEAAPLFYYNLNRHPSSRHLAQLVVGTHDRGAVPEVISFARGFARRELPEASTAVSRLQQGLPIDAPIEIRVYGPGLRQLNHAADLVLAALRKIPGTVDQYHDLGVGTPTLRFEVNDAAAGRYGLERPHLTRALLARSGGVPVGQYRAGEDPVPIVIRSPNRASAAGLTAVEIATEGGTSVPVGQIATSGIDWLPGAIHRRNRRLVATVSSHLEDGVTSQAALKQFRKRLASVDLPPRTSIEYGGEAEGSSIANGELFHMLPFGAFLLLCVLMAEFRSFRRVGIILVTVPLAAAGIVPGLLLFGQPFGFMSILGTVSLTGIVVNNAILLLDVVDRQRRSGLSVGEALVTGVGFRIRPVLLTTVTTIAGLLPLALSGTELWPPMAFAIISGLSASTLLTLIVVPSLYWLAFSRESA
jgi:multidrug efflux pump subunit AcrB